MPQVTVVHRPELTFERALGAFRDHFDGKYRVGTASLLGVRRIVVDKSDWVGVTIDLRQETGSTSFSLRGYIPSSLYSWLFGGLIAIMFLRKSWREMEREVTAFIEAAPDFN